MNIDIDEAFSPAARGGKPHNDAKPVTHGNLKSFRSGTVSHAQAPLCARVAGRHKLLIDRARLVMMVYHTRRPIPTFSIAFKAL